LVGFIMLPVTATLSTAVRSSNRFECFVIV
jgi:hypothetical protein